MTTVLEALNSALHLALREDERVFLIGEDILDPYGGAFKVTRGLSEAFPGRLYTSPVSEAGITGLAAGMALRGLRPVVEVMFGDFITLAADQLINAAAKFRWMYAEQLDVPMVIRTPMGGRRGYGPTHSQTLEKLFLGVPGLVVLAPAAIGSPGDLLSQAILRGGDPTLFIENKLLYLATVLETGHSGEFLIEEVADPDPEPKSVWASRVAGGPTYRLQLRGAPAASLTLAAYGHMAELAREAALTLAYEDELFCELIVPTRLAPLQAGPIIESARRTGRLLVMEEGSLSLGWGAEVLARLLEGAPVRPPVARRLAARDTPIPAAPGLEAATLPGLEDILKSARQLMADHP